MRKILFLLIVMFAYSASWGQTYLTESFEGAWSGTPAVPSGWNNIHTAPTGGGSGTSPLYWAKNTWNGSSWSATGYGAPTTPTGAFDGSSVAWYNDYNAKATQKDQITTGNVDLSTSTNPRVSFYLAINASSSLTLKLRGSNDGGTSWADIQTITKPGVAWTKISVTIPASYKVSNARFGIEVTTTYGSYDVWLDKFVIDETPSAMTGIYTINNTLATTTPLLHNGTSNFASFTDAINAINERGISGAVTFNVSKGQTFNENAPALTATGITGKSIVFQRSGTGSNPKITPTGTTGTTDAGIIIHGGDYITFDGIDIDASAVTAVEYGYIIRNASATNGAQNNTIINSSITLNRGANSDNSYSSAIFQTASSTAGGIVPTNATGANSYNKYHDLTIQNALNGVYLNGNGSYRDLSCEVGGSSASNRNSITNLGPTGNTFTTSRGIYAINQEDVKIFNNDISSVAADQAAAYGIYFTTCYGTANRIYNNKIHSINVKGSTTTTSIAYGVRADLSTSGTNNVRIFNNFISNIYTSFTSTATVSRYAIGMLVGVASASTSQSYDIDNNSISIGHGLTPTYSNTCIELQNANPILRIRGNIFANFTGVQAGAAKHFCAVVTSAGIAGTGTAMEFNDYFIAISQGTSGHLGRNNSSSTNYNALSDWKTFTTGTLDDNSLEVDPIFLNNNTDLHATASSINAVSGFAAQAWILTDFDNETRSSLTPHDIGADAFNPPSCSLPTSLTSSSVTATTATISWTAPASAPGSGYEYYLSTSSTAPLAGTSATGTTAAGVVSKNLSSLSSSTLYYFWVRSACSPSDLSSWAGSSTFTTACGAETAPTATQTFATFTGTAPNPICWSEATGAVAAPSTLTSVNSEWFNSSGFANTGTNVGVKTNLYGTNVGEWIISNQIDLGVTPSLYRLSYNMAVTSYNGTTSQATLGTHIVRVIISTDGGTTWSSANTLKTYTGAATYSNTGQTEIINLTGYSGVVKIAFVATTSSNTPDIDFHIDDFKVEALPSCVEPTALTASNQNYTSATISWTSPAGTPDGFEYEVRTSGAAGSGATGLAASGTTAHPTVTANISGLTGATTYTYYVRTDCGSGSFSSWVSSTVTTLSCNIPTAVTVSDIANISATISWTAPAVGSPLEYEIEVRTSGAGGSGATGLMTSGSSNLSPIYIAGLSASTSYSIYIRTHCVGSLYSSWTSATTFTTACNPISALPHTEPFATYLPSTCWSEGDVGDLTAGPTIITATASSWIEDGFLNSGSTGAAKINIDATGDNDWLISPQFTLPATPNQRLKFSVGATQYGATTAPTTAWEADDYVQVLVSNSGNTNWVILKTYNNTNVPSHLGQIDNIDLSAYADQTIKFAFRGVEGATNGTADIDFFIDNFVIEAIPSCIEPTSLTSSSITSTSATISWTAPVSAPGSGYEYYLSTLSSAPLAGTAATGTTAAGVVTKNLSSLSSNTTYYFWVRSNCDGTNKSPWAGSASFYTGYCTPSSSSVDGTGITNVTFGVSPNTVNNTSVAEVNHYGNYSAQIGDLQKEVTSTVAITFSTATYDYNTKIWIDFNDDLDFNDAGEEVYSGLSGSSSPNTLSATFTIPSSVSLGNHRMRIGAGDNAAPTSCATGLTYTCFEDYTVNVVAAPSCIPPTALTSSAVMGTTATISWSASTSTPSEGYEYYLSTTSTAPTAGTTATGTTAAGIVSKNLIGLSGSTTYYFWVRSACSPSEVSTWAGSATFTTPKPEPTNQPTNFAAGAVTTSAIPLTWTAALAGTQLPDGYLVKASSTDFATVINPVDGTDPANLTVFTAGLANKKQTTGTSNSTTSFTGMTAGTMYFYKIYSYTNTGANIDFKTDAVPTLKYATKPNPATTGAFASTTSTTANITWVAPTGYDATKHSILVFVKAGSAITQGTPNNAPSSYTANAAYTTGTAYQNDASAYCVYKGDGTNVSITGIVGSSTYHVLIYSVVDETNSNTTNSYSAALTASGSTPCEAKTIPFFEGFEANHTNGSAIGNCWTQVAVSGTASWNANSSNVDYNRTPKTGSFNSTLTWNNNRWMFQEVTLVGGTNYTFEMYARQDGATAANASITVSYGSVASAAGMTNVIIAQTGIINGNYQLLTATFTPASSGNYYIGINGNINSNPYYISIDDISLYATPSCLAPTSVTSSSVGANTATISWTASVSNPTGGYQYEIRTSGAAGSGGVGLTTNGNTAAGVISKNISGLLPSTTYNIYVRSDCGGDYSPWTNATSFTTQPVAVVPYLEGFATTSTPTAYDVTGWTIGSARGVTGNPGNNIYRNLYGSAISGTFTTINIGQIVSGMKLSFDFKLANFTSPYGAPALNSGNFTVSISTDYGLTYTLLETVTNNAVSGWQSKEYDLATYAGQYIKIKIIGNWTSGDYDLAFDNLKVDYPPYWTGAVSSDWNTAGNWSNNTVPTSTTNALITNVYSNAPIVNQSKATPAVCKNLTINNGATFTINDNKALTVSGSIVNNGTFKILSTATGDGSLLVSGGISGSGVYKVDKYFTASMWHLVSSPITNAVSGIFSNIWLRPYNEATNLYGAYITSTSTPMTVGQGFSVWTNSTETRTFSGTINDGSVGPINLQLTGGVANVNKGWNLIGNPYPSAIDWNAASGWTKNNVAGSIYIWKNNQYATYNGAVGTNGGSQNIALGQGFLVQANNAGASISMNNNVRVHNTVAFMKTTEPSDIIRVTVLNAEFSDESVIMIRSTASNSFDYILDAAKLRGASNAPQLFTMKNEENEMAISAHRTVQAVFGKYVYFEPADYIEHAIYYTQTIQTGQVPLLFDHVSQTTIHPNVPFVFTPSPSDPINRFQFIEPLNSGINTPSTQDVMVWENDNKLYVNNLGDEKLMEIKIFDMQGRLVFQGNQSISDLNQLTPATYVVKVATNVQTIVKKIMIK